MLVAGQRVADEDGVGFVGVERAVGLVGDLQMVDPVPGIEQQRLVRAKAQHLARRVVSLVECVVSARARCEGGRGEVAACRHSRHMSLGLLGADPGTVNVFFDFAPLLAYECRRSKGSLKAMNQRPVRPGPRPGVLDIAAYVPGRSKAPAGVRLHKLSSNETPLGPSPARDRGLSRGRGEARPLPRRRAARSPRGDFRDFRPQCRPHRLRCRLGRPPLPHRPRLHRLRRRGHLYRARLRHLSDRDSRRGRHPRGRAGAPPHH